MARSAGVIGEADRLDWGSAPDGSGPWHLEALYPPGLAPGHLAFYEPHYQLLFAGDLISTLSSVVIAPPDGELALYLASLRRLLALPARLLLPPHGRATGPAGVPPPGGPAPPPRPAGRMAPAPTPRPPPPPP